MNRFACRFAVLLLLLAGLLPALVVSAAEARRVIRVGYPIQQGLTEKDEQGNYFGYTCEYLEEIAQYTGWEFEFVEVDGDQNESLSTLLDMLIQGEIDLMGGMIYSEALAQRVDYVGQSYGQGYTVLNVHEGSTAIIKDDYSSMQNMRVAAIRGAATRQAELAQFCTTNNIAYELLLCDTDEEQLQALLDGRADAALDVDMNLAIRDGMRTVARFSPRPFYFAMTKGNSKLVQEMNKAIITISEVDPTFSISLYDHYFGERESALFLSVAERAFIKDVGPLRVGFSMDQPPFQYADGGALKGIAKDLMDYVSEQVGLSFELVPTDTIEDLEALARTGQLDLVASMTGDHNLARRLDMSTTRPYLSCQYSMMLGPGVSELSLEDKRLALSTTLGYEDPPENAIWYDDFGQCLEAILNGEADYTYGNSYSSQYYINQPRYRNFRLIPQAGDVINLCAGVSRNADPMLLPLLNKILASIPPETLQEIIYQNAVHPLDYSFRTLIEANPAEFLTVIVLAAGCIIAALALLLVVRIRRSRRDLLEIQKHYQLYGLSNEEFFEYDFLHDTLTISVQASENPDKSANVNRRVRNDPALPPERREALGTFMDLVRGLEDGVRDQLCRGEDGEDRWVRLTTRRICDKDGTPVYVVGKLTDIDEEKRAQEALLDRAQRDSLTGLFNPVESRSRISGALARPEGAQGALLILDIDHFKEVNDLCGHYTGDDVLRQIGAILLALFRREDVVGRLGGDEFLVYMDRVSDRAAVEARCHTLLSGVRKIHTECRLSLITVSVGAALARPGMDYDALYQAADRALYDSKRSGRDCSTIV